MRSWRAAIAWTALLSIARADAPARPVRVGERAPALAHLRDEDGKPFAFGSGWVVVMLGFEQCADCLDGLVVFNRLAGTLGDRATFAAIDATGEHADRDVEYGERLYSRLRPVHVRLLVDSDDRGTGDYLSLLHYTSPGLAPITVVIDPKGIVRYLKRGFDRKHVRAEAAELEHALTALIPSNG
jgi:hypothetical protein